MKTLKVIGIWVAIALIVVLIPFLVQLGMIKSNNIDGWLGFWGAYLGAIIGIIGVFFQVNRQRKDEINRIAESVYPKIRVTAGTIILGDIQPRVIQEYPQETIKERDNRLKRFASLWRDDDSRISGVSFFNASSNNFYDVIVRVQYAGKKPINSNDKPIHRRSDTFIIPQLTNKVEDAIIFHIQSLLPAYFDRTVSKKESLKVVKSITLWGTTEANEVLKFEFKDLQAYNFMPDISSKSSSVEEEYRNLAKEDIYPLIRVSKSLGEEEQKRQNDNRYKESLKVIKQKKSDAEKKKESDDGSPRSSVLAVLITIIAALWHLSDGYKRPQC